LFKGDRIQKRKKRINIARVLLVASVIIFSSLILILFTKDYNYTGEVIGVASFLATLIAIYFAFLASEETIQKIDDLGDLYREMGKEQRNRDPEVIPESRIYTAGEMHYLAEKMIEKVLKEYKISFNKQSKLRNDEPDYSIQMKNKNIPVEIKTYILNITIDASKELIQRLNNSMVRYLEKYNSDTSLLIIWNPGITQSAYTEIYRIFDKRIRIIQGQVLDLLENKFRQELERELNQ
jgi:hypothetical protein